MSQANKARAALLWGLCATGLVLGVVQPAEAARAKKPKQETGVASFYGDDFHGRTTASGERFDKNALTAAHAHLPLGTRVRVTNMRNKKSVVVKINDRGPYAKRRIIDVSKRAAKELGFLSTGVAEVRVEIVAYNGTGPKVN